MLVMYSVLCPTTRLPSHCVQVKETRKRLYHSESGVKKMAVRHHLDESSCTMSEATTCSQERGSRGRTLSSWMKVGKIWVWGPVWWRFECGDQWGGDLGVGTSGVEIWVWGPVEWRFGCGDQWGGDLGAGTSGVEIWVRGPVGWRFGCEDQWDRDLGVGTSGVEIWVWGPVSGGCLC